MRFENKSVVVTGAAAGMGKEITRRYLTEGAQVLAVDLSEEKLQDLAKEFAQIQLPGTLEIYKADISKVAEAEGMIDQAVNKFGKLDILVNNAGISGRCEPVGELEDEFGYGRVRAGMDPQFVFGETKNIADAVLFVSGDEGAFINGANIVVDGGMSCN